MHLCNRYIFTARKRSLRRLCFYRCLSVHRGEGACVVAPGGGCAWLLPGRGCAWLLPGGACMVAPGGGMRGCSGGVCGCSGGGVCGCSRGGMCGCSGGACMVARGGGVRGFFDEIQSMSGRYASYWNAFLFFLCSWKELWNFLSMFIIVFNSCSWCVCSLS